MKDICLNKIVGLGQRGYFTSGILELTSRCNLACKYCYVKQSDEDLTFDQITSVIDQLDDAGVLLLLLTGGELFIREDITDILEYIGMKKFFQIYLLSNGTCITEQHRAVLSKYRQLIGCIRISFFSHEPAIHDNYTGVPGSFHRALEVAHALRSDGITTRVMINLLEENMDTIFETKRFFSDAGFYLYLGTSKSSPADKCNADCYWNTTSRDFYRSYFSMFTEKELQKTLNERKKTDLDSILKSNLCQRVFTTVAIRSDGSVAPCPSFRNYSIGNVKEISEPLQDLVRNSPLIQKLRSLRIGDIEKCSKCEYVSECNFCPGMIHTELNSFAQPLEQSCNYIGALHDTLSDKKECNV